MQHHYTFSLLQDSLTEETSPTIEHPAITLSEHYPVSPQTSLERQAPARVVSFGPKTAIRPTTLLRKDTDKDGAHEVRVTITEPVTSPDQKPPPPYVLPVY